MKGSTYVVILRMLTKIINKSQDSIFLFKKRVQGKINYLFLNIITKKTYRPLLRSTLFDNCYQIYNDSLDSRTVPFPSQLLKPIQT